MSDPTDSPTPADGTWFRAQIDPVLDAEPVADAWDEIAARAQGALLAPVPATAARPHARRWLAAAAVIVLLAGAALVVAGTRGDDSSSLTTDQPEATGWYVPTGLPEGWSLKSATMIEDECNHVTKRWEGEDPDGAEPGVAPNMELDYDPCGALDESERFAGPALGPEVGSSQLASFNSKPSGSRIRWESDGAWTLVGTAVTEDELVAAAKDIVADPTSEGPLPSGMELRRSDTFWGEVSNRVVRLELVAPNGYRVRYALADPAVVPARNAYGHDAPVEIAGQPEPVISREFSPTLCCTSGSRYIGRWPGALADFDRGPDFLPAARFPTDEEVAEQQDLIKVLVGSLRPATTEEWRTFVATAAEQPVSTQITDATSLLDLLDDPIQRTTDTTMATSDTTAVDDPATTSTTATTTTTTAPGVTTDGTVVSGIGVAQPAQQPSDSYSDLDGLELRLEVMSSSIRAGQPVQGVLLIHNTTDELRHLNECTTGLMQWGLIPADDPEADPAPRSMIDCYDTPTISVPGGGDGRLPVDLMNGGFHAQNEDPERFSGGYLGTLPGGTYLAVAEVRGKTSTVRMTVPVRVPDPACPTTDALAQRYLDLTADEAMDQAMADGLEYREVRIDGEDQGVTWDLDCDRINVDLWNGVVTNVVRY